MARTRDFHNYNRYFAITDVINNIFIAYLFPLFSQQYCLIKNYSPVSGSLHICSINQRLLTLQNSSSNSIIKPGSYNPLHPPHWNPFPISLAKNEDADHSTWVKNKTSLREKTRFSRAVVVIPRRTESKKRVGAGVENIIET